MQILKLFLLATCFFLVSSTVSAKPQGRYKLHQPDGQPTGSVVFCENDQFFYQKPTGKASARMEKSGKGFSFTIKELEFRLFELEDGRFVLFTDHWMLFGHPDPGIPAAFRGEWKTSDGNSLSIGAHEVSFGGLEPIDPLIEGDSTLLKLEFGGLKNWIIYLVKVSDDEILGWDRKGETKTVYTRVPESAD